MTDFGHGRNTSQRSIGPSHFVVISSGLGLSPRRFLHYGLVRSSRLWIWIWIWISMWSYSIFPGLVGSEVQISQHEKKIGLPFDPLRALLNMYPEGGVASFRTNLRASIAAVRSGYDSRTLCDSRASLVREGQVSQGDPRAPCARTTCSIDGSAGMGGGPGSIRRKYCHVPGGGYRLPLIKSLAAHTMEPSPGHTDSAVICFGRTRPGWVPWTCPGTAITASSPSNLRSYVLERTPRHPGAVSWAFGREFAGISSLIRSAVRACRRSSPLPWSGCRRAVKNEARVLGLLSGAPLPTLSSLSLLVRACRPARRARERWTGLFTSPRSPASRWVER